MLKKVLPIILLASFLFFGQAEAITWHTANQTTVSWDAVVVASGVVQYEVFAADNVTDPDKDSPISLWRGSELVTTVTLPAEGEYIIGVKTWRIIDATTELESVIGWSDDPLIVGGAENVFGIKFYEVPGTVTNLKPGP